MEILNQFSDYMTSQDPKFVEDELRGTYGEDCNVTKIIENRQLPAEWSRDGEKVFGSKRVVSEEERKRDERLNSPESQEALREVLDPANKEEAKKALAQLKLSEPGFRLRDKKQNLRDCEEEVKRWENRDMNEWRKTLETLPKEQRIVQEKIIPKAIEVMKLRLQHEKERQQRLEAQGLSDDAIAEMELDIETDQVEQTLSNLTMSFLANEEGEETLKESASSKASTQHNPKAEQLYQGYKRLLDNQKEAVVEDPDEMELTVMKEIENGTGREQHAGDDTDVKDYIDSFDTSDDFGKYS
mmetsp:Transcript_14577/g.28727  ORF Transcript_14577/g.28727 Transcript_14577/m.28727 type:complete len:299 (+) Transcript_14577:68-964(+)